MKAPGVESYVNRLPRNVREAYEERLKELASDPYPRRNRKGFKELHGKWKGYLACVFFGKAYRIVYSVDEEKKTVYIKDVGPRGDIYK
jgi:mRNA-degrading endonuclease RelE of RelBE toxin-antitoxin system